jgi:imidazoleglycerol-phosphate dehydratase
MRPSPDTRQATVIRNTRETQIELTLNLDEPLVVSGEPAHIESPLPFLNHMLNTLATHGRFGFTLKASGDIDVDPHHLVEDTGIVLGQALKKALGGSFSGIERAGCFQFPMDGTLANLALDLCGRPNLYWQVPLLGQPLGALDSRLFREFYKGFVDGALATVHVVVAMGDNDHHMIEASFKAFARALRQATRPLEAGVMSTKGTLDI